jgi:DNA-binding PadR family transcriptional regulator
VRTRAREATKTLTTTESAVLALLALNGESSGYDLLKQARRSIGFIWSPARSQLYNVLPKLVERGCALARTVAQTTRPDKTLYRITPAGRTALEEWLESEAPDRDTFFLKLFVGGLMRDEPLVEHVERFRADIAERLEELRELEPTNTRDGNDYYHWFLLRLGLDQYELYLSWADWVLEELRGRRR